MIDQERVQSLFRKLEKLLSHAASPTAERVHQVRTTARRLEAILQVCYPEPPARIAKLMRQLKKLRKRAGQVRDLDVQTAALRGLKIGRESERKARFLSHLADARAAAEEQFQDAVADAAGGKLAKRLRRTAEELEHQVTADDSLGTALWMSFDPVSSALRLFARANRQTKTLTAENLHSFRTRCKRIRYVAEMAGNTREAQQVVLPLERLQDAVGDWHDWNTLTRTAEELFANSLDSALVSALRNISSAKFTQAKMAAQETRAELMRQYRAMLATERETRELAAGERKPSASSRRKPVASVPREMAAAEVA